MEGEFLLCRFGQTRKVSEQVMNLLIIYYTFLSVSLTVQIGPAID